MRLIDPILDYCLMHARAVEQVNPERKFYKQIIATCGNKTYSGFASIFMQAKQHAGMLTVPFFSLHSSFVNFVSGQL